MKVRKTKYHLEQDRTQNTIFEYRICHGSNFLMNFCRIRPIGISVPVEKPSNVTTNGVPHNVLAPRARYDRARSEAILRKQSPITTNTIGTSMTTGAQSVSFSNDAETVPTRSTGSADLYRKWSAIVASNGVPTDAETLLIEARRGVHTEPRSRATSSTSSRTTYFHHPSNIVKSSIRSKYSTTTFRNNF